MLSMPSDFEPRASAPLLGLDEIHVWSLDLDAALSPGQIGVAAQAALAHLLCTYANCAQAPRIERGAHGKPFAPALPDLHFNLSHAGPHVLIAFACAQALGVDLERSGRRVSCDGIAQRFFSSGEAAAICALPPAIKVPAFLHLWTHKEAVLKAFGQGLAFGLHRVQFALDAEGRAAGMIYIAPEAGDVAQWCVLALEPGPGLIGALAWRGTPRSVRTFSLSPR